jgi:photosystem II stability/assembly factor-like uncharacterized protein
MKKIFLLFEIALVINTANGQSWEYLSTLPSPNSINSISVVNQNVIWVCGDGTACYLSTNGGFNWVPANTGLPLGELYGISAIDENTCWVGRFSGAILKTTNGGVSWTQQHLESSSFMNGIKMFDANFGVYFGNPTALTNQNYQLRRTTNGGLNWILSQTAPIAMLELGTLNGWDCIDTSTFWFGSGNLSVNASYARVYRTTTGFFGTWSYSNVPGTGGSQGLFYGALAFVNASSGLAGSNSSSIMKTTDGGVTWSPASNPPGLTNYSCINMFGFKDASNLIRLVTHETSGYKVFKTTDLGASWTLEVLPPEATVNGIQHMLFLNQNLGYAGGGAGKFFRYGPPIGVKPISSSTPDNYVLDQNTPNPFNPSTKIEYYIPRAGEVKITVFNISGQEVSVLVNEFKNRGVHTVGFNASNLSSGVYFYRMVVHDLSTSFLLTDVQAGDFTDTKKMLIIK